MAIEMAIILGRLQPIEPDRGPLAVSETAAQAHLCRLRPQICRLLKSLGMQVPVGSNPTPSARFPVRNRVTTSSVPFQLRVPNNPKGFSWG